MGRFNRLMSGSGVVAALIWVQSSASFGQAPRGPMAGPPPQQGPRTAGGAPSAASPRPAAAASAPVDPQAEALERRQMEKLLGLWEIQSARLKTLDVGFTRIDKSEAWDEVVEYRGRGYFQAPNLACLHFQRVDDATPTPGQPAPAPGQAKKKKLVEHERIICSGAEVFQYEYATKQIFVFPLDKDQRKKALDEGPLPFLFNMKAGDAKQRYRMQLIKQSEDAYLIGILPILREDMSVFSKAFLQLNKKSFLPDRLVLISPNGKDTQDYVFNGIAPNGPINPAFFKGVEIAGWKRIYNPGADDQKGAVKTPRQQPAVGREAMPAPRR